MAPRVLALPALPRGLIPRCAATYSLLQHVAELYDQAWHQQVCSWDAADRLETDRSGELKMIIIYGPKFIKYGGFFLYCRI